MAGKHWIECDDHKAVQHRDGKEMWCDNCKLTVDFRKPEVSLKEFDR